MKLIRVKNGTETGVVLKSSFSISISDSNWLPKSFSKWYNNRIRLYFPDLETQFQTLNFILLEIQKQIKNRDASATQNELRQMTFELRRVDQEIHEKNDQIEKLNRDLRKVNLQSFVRETNSTKVKR